jgi:hypothetical protein
LWIKNFAITEDFYILSGLIRDKWDDFIDRRIGELDE